MQGREGGREVIKRKPTQDFRKVCMACFGPLEGYPTQAVEKGKMKGKIHATPGCRQHAALQGIEVWG